MRTRGQFGTAVLGLAVVLKWKGCLKVALVAGGSLFLGGRASAQFAITIAVDENGNGTFRNTTGFFSPLSAALLPDPGPGGLTAALTYGFLNPPGLTAGDLVLLEQTPTVTLFSDMIRFNPNQIAPDGSLGTLVFYSDKEDTPLALGDTGFPGNFYDNHALQVEVGPEGNNGFTYTPTAGQPGFVAGAAGPVTYVIESDVPTTTAPVPAPPAVVLVGLGAGCVAVRRYVGRRATA
jgi:hypothetical protein